MIRLADETNIEIIHSFCQNSATGCRISASLSAYGLHNSFHYIWMYYNENNILTGVIGKIGGAVTVCYKDYDIPDEIMDFLSMQPDVSEIVYEKNNSKNLVMKYTKGAVFEKSEKNISFNKARDIFYVIEKSGDTDIKADDSLYVDISHRIRHGSLMGVTAYLDDKPVSCVCAHISENDALVTAVETLPDYRKQGFASSLILSLCHELRGRNIFLMCKGELEEFYKNTGFEKCGGFIIESAVF